jgi:hypothetical protein
MRTPEWYKQKVEDIRCRKRELTSKRDGELYEGKVLDNKRKKQVKEDLKREKRAAKRGEKQDMKKEVEREIWFWNKNGGWHKPLKWECSSEAEQRAVNSKVVGSIPAFPAVRSSLTY